MICITKHFFFDHHYKVFIDNHSFNIGKSQQHPKYQIPLSNDLQLKWVFENRELTGFRIRLKKKWKQFDMSKNDCYELKQQLDGKIAYTNIENLYNELSTIGTGSYSEVFLIQNLLNGKLHVAKKMSLQQKYVKEVFQNEVQSLQDLKHKNIVQLKEFYINYTDCFIITNYNSGETLAKYNKYHRKKKCSEIVFIIQQLLECLSYIHSQGYIHRDIKPENILLTEQLDLTLIDFGFATKVAEPAISAGTIGYVAPEIFSNQQQSTKCDIFSAGALLYELIYGKKLFEGKHKLIFKKQTSIAISILVQQSILFINYYLKCQKKIVQSVLGLQKDQMKLQNLKKSDHIRSYGLNKYLRYYQLI